MEYKSWVKDINKSRIACIGAGYVGAPTMAVLADKCEDLEVFVLDIDEKRIAAYNSSQCPIYEPGLQELINRRRGKNLFFSTDIEKYIDYCDILFVSVNTPTKTFGIGAGKAADLSIWEIAGRNIAKHAKSNKIIIEKSTVPVRTAAALAHVLEANENPGVEFVVLSVPEFLAEGTALRDLYDPDRVLLGGPDNLEPGREAIALMIEIYSRFVPREKIIAIDLWSSELCKLVCNAMLAQRISSVNSLAMLCEKAGADIQNVTKAAGMDSRIGSKFLQASVGFGGSCFKKDVLNLVYICETFGLKEVAAYWQSVVDFNEYNKAEFAHRIVRALFNTVRGKKIAVFGFAFKKDTGDTRETAAATVCKELMREGARVCVFDPKVLPSNAIAELRSHGVPPEHLENNLEFVRTPCEAATGADAIAILTEWDEFKTYDYNVFLEVMRRPATIFDGRNVVDHVELHEMGFDIYPIGKEPLVRQSRFMKDSILTPLRSTASSTKATSPTNVEFVAPSTNTVSTLPSASEI